MTSDFHSGPIPAKKLRSAIGKLEQVLGRASYEALIEELERHGIRLWDDAAYYPLWEIEQRLEAVFGKDVANLLMERIKRDLRE